MILILRSGQIAECEIKTPIAPLTRISNTLNTAIFNAKAYPNPFAETLTFMYENKNNTEYRLEIFDIKGNTVFSGFSNEGTILVKANGIITVGEYLYNITSNGNFLQNGKIIKN